MCMRVYGNFNATNRSRTTGPKELCASVPAAGENGVLVYDEGACVGVKSPANIKLSWPFSRIRGLGTKYWSKRESGTETGETSPQVVNCMSHPEGTALKGLWDLELATSNAIIWTRYQRGCFAFLFMR